MVISWFAVVATIGLVRRLVVLDRTSGHIILWIVLVRTIGLVI